MVYLITFSCVLLGFNSLFFNTSETNWACEDLYAIHTIFSEVSITGAQLEQHDFSEGVYSADLLNSEDPTDVV